MQKIMVLGAGKIGSLVASLLSHSPDYQIYLVDVDFQLLEASGYSAHNPNVRCVSLDIHQTDALRLCIKTENIQTLVSCLPYYANIEVAHCAAQNNLNYFDLTEDVSVTDAVTTLSRGEQSAFVPQCGLAPGFISLVAHDLMQKFDVLDTVKLRVGALPQASSHALRYALTWSTDGLINEYGNLGRAIVEGRLIDVQPLEGLEAIQIEGHRYEAFNTSGGIGSLAKRYQGLVKNLDYKTIRYPGHCNHMRFLMRDLQLNQDRETLKRVLEHALPRTDQDLVLLYVSVSGLRGNAYLEEHYTQTIYPKIIHGMHWSAIQVSTASALAAVIDLNNEYQFKGLVTQEQFTLEAFLKNRFGTYYAKEKTS